MPDQILIRGARLHNLKNIDVAIPKNRLVVLTGLSGSGKSTLAFDTLYQEGARQYMESLGMVTYQSKPPVSAIEGLSPSISVDQHLTNHSPRSTVGTSTEVFTYLRVLFARLGHRPCPACGRDVPPASELEGDIFEADESGPLEGETVPCPHCGEPLPALGMASFSFNKPEGACPACTGLGVVADVRVDQVFDPKLGVADGGVLVWDVYNADRLSGTLQRAGEHYGFVFDVHQPVGELGEAARDLLYWGVDSAQFQRHFPGAPPPPTVFKGHFEGVIPNLQRRYPEGTSNTVLGVRLEGLFTRQACPDCAGTRLRLESRQVQVGGRTIIELSQMPLESLAAWLNELSASLAGDQDAIASPVLTDLEERIQRLVEVGVGYLSMERSSPSLSAGEAQRLRLASLLGSGLTGVLYVLDEPTIGLHPRDTGRLIQFLRRLRDLGNTVLVIEHDLEVIRSADHVIEFGPGGGKHGGEIVVAGTPDDVARHPASPTGAYLSGRARFPAHPPRLQPHGALVIHGARAHNLKNITVRLPLGCLLAVTGVSGSGKSSLLFDILDRAARQRLYGALEAPGDHDRIEGWEHLSRLATVDQSPIGRSTRSNAATYTEVFSDIRRAFGALEEARRRKLSARHFSFNVPGGRCERCEGAGVLTVNMHFLPDVQVRCPACKGKRFTKEVLAVEYRGASIADVLDMTIEEALALFEGVPAITRRLGLLAEVGLGYLQLGQPATTLSGGEAQRVKLARELARGGNGHTLYLLDEPTTGLHPADVARLLTLLQRLVDAGNSVFVIEHHLELIRCADWVIDLGPEGGWAGGELVAAGTPASLAAEAASHTARCLAERSPLPSR